MPLPLAFMGLLLLCLQIAQPTSVCLEMGDPLSLSIQLDEFWSSLCFQISPMNNKLLTLLLCRGELLLLSIGGQVALMRGSFTLGV